MIDLFEREQVIYDCALKRIEEIEKGAEYSIQDFKALTKEYGVLLRQLRRVTKLSDRTTVNLNESKLDLLDKIHYDALTGIYNRRFIEENLNKIVKSASRVDGTISVMMIDVDFFKKYNDTYGHSMGDECLKLIAGALKKSITRDEDFVARYGGEEFAVVLPNSSEEGAHAIAARILENVRRCNIPHEKSVAAEYVTVSVGVTNGRVKKGQTGEDYLKQADEALYISKNSGRNKYTFTGFQEVNE